MKFQQIEDAGLFRDKHRGLKEAGHKLSNCDLSGPRLLGFIDHTEPAYYYIRIGDFKATRREALGEDSEWYAGLGSAWGRVKLLGGPPAKPDDLYTRVVNRFWHGPPGEQRLRELLQEAHEVIVQCIGPLDWHSGGTMMVGVDLYGKTLAAKTRCTELHSKLHDVLGKDAPCRSAEEE